MILRFNTIKLRFKLFYIQTKRKFLRKSLKEKSEDYHVLVWHQMKGFGFAILVAFGDY